MRATCRQEQGESYEGASFLGLRPRTESRGDRWFFAVFVVACCAYAAMVALVWAVIALVAFDPGID